MENKMTASEKRNTIIPWIFCTILILLPVSNITRGALVASFYAIGPYFLNPKGFNINKLTFVFGVILEALPVVAIALLPISWQIRGILVTILYFLNYALVFVVVNYIIRRTE